MRLLARSIVATSFAALLSCVACGPAPQTRGAGAVAPLGVHRVAWNGANVGVGHARGVAEAGDVVAVFADEGATVFSSGARVAADRRVTGWRDASVLPAADGSGSWIVGIDGRGRLFRLRGTSEFEDVTDRYGLAGARVVGATLLGTGYAGFLFDHAIAIADGRALSRYTTPDALVDLVGGGGYGAGWGAASVTVFDVAKRAVTTYPLEGVTRAAVDPAGRLYATTSRAVYAADDRGALTLVFDAERDAIHGLAASGDRVWFADGVELGVVDVRGRRVAETSGARVAADATLAASPSGDVWVLSAGGVDRFGVEAGSAGGSWGTLGPIFARACAGCHLPGGEAGTDLSSASRWAGERGEIRERVMEKRTMPPEGHVLSEEDREAIRAWVEGASAQP